MECFVPTSPLASAPQPLEGQTVPATVRMAFAPSCPLGAAQSYTRRLALGHYENFSVLSMLLPRYLRQDFSNVYAFCRTADDLGDEVADKSLALSYLGRFRDYTLACYEGRPLSPLFVALARTIENHQIPIQPF